MHTATIAETYFVLGGMRIRVNAGRIHRQIQYVGRVAAVKKNVPISMTHGMRKSFVHNTAAIDEPVLHVRLAAVICRQREPARKCNAFRFPFEV